MSPAWKAHCGVTRSCLINSPEQSARSGGRDICPLGSALHHPHADALPDALAPLAQCSGALPVPSCTGNSANLAESLPPPRPCQCSDAVRGLGWCWGRTTERALKNLEVSGSGVTSCAKGSRASKCLVPRERGFTRESRLAPRPKAAGFPLILTACAGTEIRSAADSSEGPSPCPPCMWSWRPSIACS